MEIQTSGSVNSLSLGNSAEILVAGQSNGKLSVIRIGSQERFNFQKVNEAAITDKNIAKVVRTTRDDFAIGT